MGNRATDMPLVASVADIRGTGQMLAPFLFEILTVQVAGRTGSALNTAERDLITHVLLLAVIAMYTEVLGIQEQSLSRIVF